MSVRRKTTRREVLRLASRAVTVVGGGAILILGEARAESFFAQAGKWSANNNGIGVYIMFGQDAGVGDEQQWANKIQKAFREVHVRSKVFFHRRSEIRHTLLFFYYDNLPVGPAHLNQAESAMKDVLARFRTLQ